MLKNQIKGLNDSWAIRWYASAFLQDKLTLFPRKPLVHNTGHDASGNHCSESGIYNVELSLNPVHIGGVWVKENKDALMAVSRFFKHINAVFYARMRSKAKRMVKGFMS